MRLNFSDHSNRFEKTSKGLIEFIESAAKVLLYTLLGLIILGCLILFGKILWSFLEIFFQALGQL